MELISTGVEDDTDYSVLNKYKTVQEGSKIAILGVGNFFEKAKEISEIIKDRFGLGPTLINPRFLTGIDKDLLDKLKANHDLILTLEDGCLDGGFGEKISRFYSSTNLKVLNFGAFKEFPDRVPLNTLYERYHLTSDLIIEDIQKTIDL